MTTQLLVMPARGREAGGVGWPVYTATLPFYWDGEGTIHLAGDYDGNKIQIDDGMFFFGTWVDCWAYTPNPIDLTSYFVQGMNSFTVQTSSDKVGYYQNCNLYLVSTGVIQSEDRPRCPVLIPVI